MSILSLLFFDCFRKKQRCIHVGAGLFETMVWSESITHSLGEAAHMSGVFRDSQ